MTTQKRREDEGAGALGGAAAGQSVYQQAGYATKHRVDRLTRKGNPGVTAEQIKTQDRVLKPLKAKHGMHLPNGSPGRDNVGYHRAYPTDLPHGRTIRALSHTHEGKLGMAIGAGATVAGAAAAAGEVHHETKVKKMDESPFFGKRDFSTKQRKKLAGKGDALPDGSFPIKNKHDLANAERLEGHSKHPAAAARLIARRKEQLEKAGCMCDCGCKSCGSSKKVAKSGSCKCDCAKCGTNETRGNANTYPFGKSAFGVEHELAKLDIGGVLDGGMDAMKGLKRGFGGRSFGAAPGSMPGMLGAKTGNSAKGGLKAIGAAVQKQPVATIGAGVGGGALMGAAIKPNKPNNQ